MAGRRTSRVWVAPELLEAIERGETFDEWLDGRHPVASVARISADQKKDEHGVAAQHRKNRVKAEENGFAVVKYYEDNNKSAADPGVYRDAFEMVIQELTARRTVEGFRIAGIACKERGRLYRRAGDYERTMEALTQYDDGVLLENGRLIDIYSDSADIEGLQNVAGYKTEIRLQKRRMREHHQTRADEGKPLAGPRRFGWKGANPRKGRPSNKFAKKSEWPHLKRMIRYAVAGKAWLTIAQDLNRRGVRTVRGNKWCGEAVRDVVSNPAICGYRVRHGEIVRDERGDPVIGDWDAPATPQQWEAIRERIRKARAQKGLPVEDADFAPGSVSTRTRSYLFSGFLRCGRVNDDGEMCNHKLSGNMRDEWIYECKANGRVGCGRLGRNGARVDGYMTELVLSKLEEYEHNIAPVAVKPWEKEAEWRKAEDSLARHRAEWRAGRISDDSFYRDLPRLEESARRLRAEHSKFVARQETSVSARGGNVRERWKKMDLAQKRAEIGKVLSAAVVLPYPPGARRNGPFRPDLIRPIWKEGHADAAPLSEAA